MLKRILPIVMSFLMLVTMAPTNALAAEPAAYPVSEVQIILTADLQAGKEDSELSVPEDMHVTIDLNGHILDRGLTETDENGNLIPKVQEEALSADETVLPEEEEPALSAPEGGSVIYVPETAALILKDSSAEDGHRGTGTLIGGFAENGGGVYNATNDAILIVQGTPVV